MKYSKTALQCDVNTAAGMLFLNETIPGDPHVQTWKEILKRGAKRGVYPSRPPLDLAVEVIKVFCPLQEDE